jgi:DNA-binding Lrp family transcriptional regulator
MPPSEALLDDTDKALLNRIQSDFPITSQPYLAVAKELGLTEQDVLERISRLKKEGIIRRIGGNFVPDKLGYVSTLCAARVPEDQIEQFAEIVNCYPGVTHNYRRDNSFNIWFTFIAPSMQEIEQNLKEISEKTGISEILNLPATRVFKIRAQFKV